MSSASRAPQAGRTAFKVVGLTLIALLVLAFYAVCSVQVRKAQARNVALEVRQAAFNDCLQYVVDSTIAGCTSRLGTEAAGTPDSAAAAGSVLMAGH